MTSLAQATTVIVVWCSHASRSNWVVREANTARELGKRIVPVFLDKTPAPDFLMQFQGIDFSGKFNHASLGSAIGNAFLGVLRAFGKALGWAAMRSLVVLVLVCGLFGMTLVVGPTSYTLAYPIIDFRELLTFVAIIALFAAGVTGISGIVSSIIAWHQHRRAIPVQARELASAIRGHLERPLTLLQGGEG